ncbi:MAG: UDP-N-acetylglucosamine 2-epimerase (non-hydrolyzing) [Liquorilactobacillus ghanensis]|uniref:non-hydrolyzing UDP-N-acetylglucosamine 2-epimerase n=1 Tax=Liquorilactobacillus TaxID=2767888 RepID=UPI00070F8186|nr:UDP-N-acetylglucosamine 2-epimerase (non-hydrolyzing) [Liquorilactobacillus ghanensis]
MKKIKVMTVFGTRPEAIKMAPIIYSLQQHPDKFETIVTVTGQHREMLEQVMTAFKLSADYNLQVMQQNQTLSDITANVLQKLEKLLQQVKPDIVLVHGDTTTTFAASLATFYEKIPLGHVEAGLRTWNKYSPFPEEMNRQLTDVLSDLYFAPTKKSRENLLAQKISADKIFVTGNTAIDALKQTVSEDYQHETLTKIAPGQRLILLTMHRRENLGLPMKQVFAAVNDVLHQDPTVEVIYPVHLNPKVQALAQAAFADNPRVHLVKPLDVIDFHNLCAKSYFIMTDSGGVQEEAPALGKPVLVLRDTTERPEGITAGTLKLVGTKRTVVAEMMQQLLAKDSKLYQTMAKAANPYGDGHAAERIIAAIEYYFKLEQQRPTDWIG